MNSVMQSLFHIPKFRAIVYSVERPTVIIRELQRLFGNLQLSSKPSSPRLLIKAFGWALDDVVMQHDAQGFLSLLLSHLKGAPGLDASISDLFIGRCSTTPRPLSLDFLTHLDTHMTLMVDIKGCGSLEDAIARLYAPAFREQYYDTKSDIPASIEFYEFPAVLMLVLSRFELNPLSQARNKITDFFSFPEDLDLSKFAPRSSVLNDYALFSVLVHSGSAAAGNYFAFIRPELGHQWYQFHDSVVAMATREQATAQNFGGTTNTCAYLLIYIRVSISIKLFEPCAVPDRIQAQISEVKLRETAAAARPLRTGRTQTIRLITEVDVKKMILEDIPMSSFDNFEHVLTIEESSTNHDIYASVSGMFTKPVSSIRLWKVGRDNLPTTALTDSLHRCPTRDLTLFLQEIAEPQCFFDRQMRLAFITFFFPDATPKVQFICTSAIFLTQTITQVFPMLWSILGIPAAVFNVYCDKWSTAQPIAQNAPLCNLGITEAAFFLFESLVPVQTHFPFEYRDPMQKTAVSYYSKVRPNGDSNALQYLERRSPQYQLAVYRVSDPSHRLAIITRPQAMPVTDLPGLILFAVKEPFDPERDTIQIFRRKINADITDLMPYPLRCDVTLKTFLITDRGASESPVFFDIIRGFSPEQLKQMVVRTCDIYDGPCHKYSRVRYPMRPSDPLQFLTQYIQREILPCPYARLLLDEDGMIRSVEIGEAVPESALLRFDVIPSDQVNLGSGEFLVVAVLCRCQKGMVGDVPMGRSFMFKIIPGELVEQTLKRIAQLQLFHEVLLSHVLIRAAQRLMNGDEALDSILQPNDTFKIILPDRLKATAIFKKAGVNIEKGVDLAP
jgi:hypothetical protein